MTKTIEEVKAAKRDLELKISQMVNEFVIANDCQVSLDMHSYSVNTMGGNPRHIYDCRIEIKL